MHEELIIILALIFCVYICAGTASKPDGLVNPVRDNPSYITYGGLDVSSPSFPDKITSENVKTLNIPNSLTSVRHLQHEALTNGTGGSAVIEDAGTDMATAFSKKFSNVYSNVKIGRIPVQVASLSRRGITGMRNLTVPTHKG